MIDVRMTNSQELTDFLYDPKGFKLLVHGIKRVWQDWELGLLNTYTELMRWVLDSGREFHEYSLAELAHQ
jgi:hypothetical protein